MHFPSEHSSGHLNKSEHGAQSRKQTGQTNLKTHPELFRIHLSNFEAGIQKPLPLSSEKVRMLEPVWKLRLRAEGDILNYKKQAASASPLIRYLRPHSWSARHLRGWKMEANPSGGHRASFNTMSTKLAWLAERRARTRDAARSQNIEEESFKMRRCVWMISLKAVNIQSS
jgi:hypothetical protein